MKKYLLSLLLSFLGIISFLPSCVRDVVLDAGENPTVVVECVLRNSDVQELRLNFTKGASKAETEPLTEAVATLIDLTESQIAGQFIKEKEDDLWTLDYQAVPGHRYRLEVQVPGYDLIWAEDEVPKMDVRAAYPESDIRYFDVFGEKLNPCIEYNVNQLVTYYVPSLPDIVYVYAMNYNSETGGHEVAEQICTDYPADDFNLTGNVYDPPMASQVRVDYVPPRYYYKYIAPPLRGDELHQLFLRIEKDSDWSKKWLIVGGDFKGEYQWNVEEVTDSYGMTFPASNGMLKNKGKILELEEGKGYVCFVGVSKLYDNFIQEAFNFKKIKESTDMSSIYIRENLPTNINGGIGIFGAMTEEKMQWYYRPSIDLSYYSLTYEEDLE